MIPIGTPANNPTLTTASTPSTSEVTPFASSSMYTVQKGDTLSTIARRYNMRWQDLASINNIASPYTLRVGQVLRLTNTTTVATPATSRTTTTTTRRTTSGGKQVARTYQQTPTVTTSKAQTVRRGTCSPPVSWQWPTQGRVAASVSESGRKGIRIAGQLRQSIKAAASGTVLYSGDGLQGYNNLIIIQHNAAFLSVYANNNRRLVAEGARITAGQAIAEMGLDTQRQASLHFEIRCQGKAVDPLPYLPNI